MRNCRAFSTMIATLAGTAATLLTLGAASSVRGDEFQLPASLRKVAFDQHLNTQLPLELTFQDESGNAVALSNYFNQGRPVILVLAYFRCPRLCSGVLNGLVRALLDIELRPGSDFDVIVISFDARETPEMAASAKIRYLERYGKTGSEHGWHFLTGGEAAIDRVAKAVGFRFNYDARRDEFAHAAGIVVLTPEGKISRYFYDIQYSPRDLRLGLVEASAHRIGSPVDQILLYCFHYDPTEGHYGVAIMNLIRLGGVLTMIGVCLLVYFLRRGERRRITEQAAKEG